MEPVKRYKVVFMGVNGPAMTKRWSLEEIGAHLPKERWAGWVGLWEDSWVGCDGEDTLFMLSPEYRAAIKRLVDSPRGQEHRAWAGLPLTKINPN